MNPPRRSSSPRLRQHVSNDAGWVMVPVLALLTIAIGLGLALLLLVDNQTRASAQQRDMDAAQTLAEGVLTSTANVLASADPSGTDWTPSSCQSSLDGNLTGTPDHTLAGRITQAVQKAFEDNDLVSTYRRAGRSAGWKIRICPTLDPNPDPRFETTVLTRTGPTGALTDGRKTLWVQAQADIRSATDTPIRSRSVAAKVQQGSNDFVPPQDVIDTSSFSTDLAVAGSSVLGGDLLGGVTRQLLGIGNNPLIAGRNDTIGVRCGLLNALSPNVVDNVLKLQMCLTGTLGGVAQVLGNTAGLGTVNQLLGINDRFRSLDGWSVAPSSVVDAYRSAAQNEPGGIYKAQVNGTENVHANGPGGNDNHPCLSTNEQPNASSVVFIERVGNNGEQYCTVPQDATARILVVARGGVRISGTFRGVVYAPNLQECGDNGCSEIERRNAVQREVVRVKYPGKVIGAIWADGAGAEVGIYPPSMTTPSSTALLNVGGTNGVCSVPLLGPLLNAVGSVLGGVLDVVFDLLRGYEYRPVGGSSATACSQLKAALGGLGSNQLLNLFGNGGTIAVPVSERRKCSGLIVAKLCTLGSWGQWEIADTVQQPIPDLFSDAGLLSQVSGLLAGTLSNYTAVQHDQAIIDRTRIPIPGGDASFVPGTYRNVPVTAPGT